jgi:F-type H+-transporting ATPase subunit gamma
VSVNIDAIVKKMKGTSDLRSLVRVMKAIAAANIREYNPAQKALLEYSRTIELGLQALLEFGVKDIRMKEVASERIGAIIFTANLGLCGQFNHQVISFFQKTFDQWKISPDQCSLLVLGEQHKEPINNMPVESYLSFPNDLSGMSLFLQEVLSKINHWITKQDIHRIFLFFNRPDSPTSYSPRVDRLSPIDQDWFDQLKRRKWNSRSLPQFTINPTKLFSSYIQEFFFISLYKTVIESYMSENVNRWQSMIMAEKHIDDYMIDLKNEYQQQWQASITEELLDIESAFEVLKKK